MLTGVTLPADNAGMSAPTLLREIPKDRRPASFLSTISFWSRLTVFLLLGCLLASAQVRFPGSTAVGASASPQAVSLTLPAGGTVASIAVLTQGNAGYDFTNANAGTCAPGNYLPGQQCTVTVGFKPVAPGLRQGAVILLDSSGAALVTQFVAATATGSVNTFIPGLMATVAGNQAWIYSGDGVPATQASIFLPFGFAVDAAGDLFIADSSNNRIRRVDGVSGVISTVAGSGVIGSTGDGGPATAASLSNPTSIAIDPAGNLYFSDSGNNSIRRIDAFTGIISTYAGRSNTHGYTGDTGPATSATLNNPSGIALDSAGNLYLADTGNHTIRMVASASGLITSVAGRGFASFSGDGGPAVSAGLNSPWSITPIPAGGLYIADQNNQRIRKIDSSGNISTVMGNGVAGYAGDNGPATAAELNVPASVALDVAGNLYVADSGNNRVRKISSKTGLVTTIAGNSGESISGDNGPADQAGLYGPYTLALDSQGSLLIADVFHNRIRKVWANQAILEFPAIRVGRVSSAMPQTLENDGNAPLNPASVLAVTNSQVDSAGTTCVSGTALEPLDTCIASLKFAPTTIGQLVTGSADVNSDAANSPGVINVSGQVLDVDPATVALTSNPNPSITGAPVTFSVTVSSDGSTPTGQITLLDGTTVLATTQLGASGAAQFVYTFTTSGNHSMTVAYAGDTSNSSAVSPALVQAVKDAQAATTTLLTSSASPIDFGATLKLTASVAVAVANSGYGTFTGTVTFKDGATVIGTAALVNQAATLSVATLSVGSHSITAVYSGCSTYLTSTSAALTQIIQMASTKLAVATSANPSFSGAPLALTATILGTGGVPSGPVAFLDGSSTLGTAVLNAQGIATLTVPGSAWTVGTHSLTATYGGDAGDSASLSPTVLETINLASTTSTLNASASPAAQGSTVTFTVIVKGNGGIPSGSVTLFDGAASVGSATLNSAGIATFPSSTLSIGSHSLTAAYAGDSLDGPSTSNPYTEVIDSTSIAITLATNASPALFAAPVVFRAQVNGTGSAPTGSVTLLDGVTPLGTVALSASGDASFTLSTLAIGSHTLTASYSGDTSHAATVSAALIQKILQATTTTVSTPSLHVVAGTGFNVSASVVGVSGKPLTGTVTFADGATTLAIVTADANGNASWNSSTLTVGQHSFTASYSGDTLDASSASAPVAAIVDIASTSVAFTTSANPVFSSQLLTLNAVVSGNGALPTGTVTFMDGSATLNVAQVTNGAAQFSTSTLAPGIHHLSASYSGDSFDKSSVSASIAEQIEQKTTVALVSSANPSLLTDAITLTVTVSNGTSSSPSGSVILTDGSATLATLALSSAGTSTYTFPAPGVGSHSLIAAYMGDSGNTAASSQPLIQVVKLRPTAISFTSSVTALSTGQPLTLISVVQGSGPAPPTGTVTWQAGSTTLGTAAIDSTGLATLTVTPVQAVYATVAQYSGDSLYAPSVSSAITITVGPPVEFTLSLQPPTMTLVSGQHGQMTISLVTAPTFSDTLDFGCAGLPASATCTFSENHIAAGGGIPHNLSVTVDTGNPLGAGATARLEDRSSGTLACALPAAGLLALLLRRKRKSLKMLGLFAATVILGALPMLSGCGSSLNITDTPAGSYTFQVVATGANTAATEVANVQLTVTK
jgi:sugar lactone lactonase YvrE